MYIYSNKSISNNYNINIRLKLTINIKNTPIFVELFIFIY